MPVDPSVLATLSPSPARQPSSASLAIPNPRNISGQSSCSTVASSDAGTSVRSVSPGASSSNVDLNPSTPGGSSGTPGSSFRGALRAFLPFSKGSPSTPLPKHRHTKEDAIDSPTTPADTSMSTRLLGSVRRLSRSDRKPSASGLSHSLSDKAGSELSDLDLSRAPTTPSSFSQRSSTRELDTDPLPPELPPKDHRKYSLSHIASRSPLLANPDLSTIIEADHSGLSLSHLDKPHQSPSSPFHIPSPLKLPKGIRKAKTSSGPIDESFDLSRPDIDPHITGLLHPSTSQQRFSQQDAEFTQIVEAKLPPPPQLTPASSFGDRQDFDDSDTPRAPYGFDNAPAGLAPSPILNEGGFPEQNRNRGLRGSMHAPHKLTGPLPADTRYLQAYRGGQPSSSQRNSYERSPVAGPVSLPSSPYQMDEDDTMQSRRSYELQRDRERRAPLSRLRRDYEEPLGRASIDGGYLYRRDNIREDYVTPLRPLTSQARTMPEYQYRTPIRTRGLERTESDYALDLGRPPRASSAMASSSAGPGPRSASAMDLRMGSSERRTPFRHVSVQPGRMSLDERPRMFHRGSGMREYEEEEEQEVDEHGYLVRSTSALGAQRRTLDTGLTRFNREREMRALPPVIRHRRASSAADGYPSSSAYEASNSPLGMDGRGGSTSSRAFVDPLGPRTYRAFRAAGLIDDHTQSSTSSGGPSRPSPLRSASSLSGVYQSQRSNTRAYSSSSPRAESQWGGSSSAEYLGLGDRRSPLRASFSRAGSRAGSIAAGAGGSRPGSAAGTPSPGPSPRGQYFDGQRGVLRQQSTGTGTMSHGRQLSSETAPSLTLSISQLSGSATTPPTSVSGTGNGSVGVAEIAGMRERHTREMGALLAALADCQTALAKEKEERKVLEERVEAMSREMDEMRVERAKWMEGERGRSKRDVFTDDEDAENGIEKLPVEETVHAPLHPHPGQRQHRIPSSYGPTKHRRQNSAASSVFTRPPLEMSMLMTTGVGGFFGEDTGLPISSSPPPSRRRGRHGLSGGNGRDRTSSMQSIDIPPSPPSPTPSGASRASRSSQHHERHRHTVSESSMDPAAVRQHQSVVSPTFTATTGAEVSMRTGSPGSLRLKPEHAQFLDELSLEGHGVPYEQDTEHGMVGRRWSGEDEEVGG